MWTRLDATIVTLSIQAVKRAPHINYPWLVVRETRTTGLVLGAAAGMPPPEPLSKSISHFNLPLGDVENEVFDHIDDKVGFLFR